MNFKQYKQVKATLEVNIPKNYKALNFKELSEFSEF